MTYRQAFRAPFYSRILFLGLLFFISLPNSWCQVQTFNYSDLYHVDPLIRCEFSLVKSDSLTIYAKLIFKEPPDDSLVISYSLQSANLSEDGSTTLKNALLPANSTTAILNWTVSQENQPIQIRLEIPIGLRIWAFGENFSLDSFHPDGGLSLWKSSLPLLDKFMVTGDSVMVKNRGLQDSLYAYFYSHNFEPGLPPMTTKASKSGDALRFDSIIGLTTHQYLKLQDPGLYFFQADTASTEGIALFVGPAHFPKPRQVSELAAPLIYITTRDEYQDISQDLTDKKALDKFWLTTVGSVPKAKASIKSYYEHIETCNELFTSYKEGWKTDRGMIYTIMGPPLTVSKEENLEVWTYRSPSNIELRFTFMKISNIFSNNHYELIREKGFDRQWFYAIERWRKGLIGF